MRMRPVERGETSCDDDVLELAARLRLAVARLQRQIRIDSGDSPLQVAALFTLELRGALRVSELAKIEAVSLPSMSRAVAALARNGFITRSPDARDGRSRLIELSSSGHDRVQEVRSLRTALVARRFINLSPEQQRAVRAALPVVEALIDE